MPVANAVAFSIVVTVLYVSGVLAGPLQVFYEATDDQRSESEVVFGNRLEISQSTVSLSGGSQRVPHRELTLVDDKGDDFGGLSSNHRPLSNVPVADYLVTTRQDDDTVSTSSKLRIRSDQPAQERMRGQETLAMSSTGKDISYSSVTSGSNSSVDQRAGSTGRRTKNRSAKRIRSRHDHRPIDSVIHIRDRRGVVYDGWVSPSAENQVLDQNLSTSTSPFGWLISSHESRSFEDTVSDRHSTYYKPLVSNAGRRKVANRESHLFIYENDLGIVSGHEIGKFLELDGVVNRGVLEIVDNAHVLVHSSFDNLGHTLIHEQSSFEKLDHAVVNNGSIVVSNQSTFTDNTIINATRANASFTVTDQSTAEAIRSFSAGVNVGRTGIVTIADGSLLSSGDDMLIGDRGVGDLTVTSSTIEVGEDLLVAGRNGSVGSVVLSDASADISQTIDVANGRDTVGRLSLVDSQVFATDLNLATRGSGSLDSLRSTIEIGEDVQLAQTSGSFGQILQLDSVFLAGRDVTIGNGSSTKTEWLMSDDSELEVGRNLTVGRRNTSVANLMVEDGSRVSVGRDLNVGTMGSLFLTDATLEVSRRTSVRGLLSLDTSEVVYGDDVIIRAGGTYETDSSHSEFQGDLQLEAGSSFLAGDDDVFELGLDFRNDIINSMNFTVEKATILFGGANPVTHEFEIAGMDVGEDTSGYIDNFSFDTLALSVGHSLTLQDPNGGGGAIYVRVIDLQGGLTQISDIDGNGLTIYYDANNPANAYLNGLTYTLGDGNGQLDPIFVPEPGTISLFVLGLLFLSRRTAYMSK